MTSKTEQRYKEALERIEKFGHSNGHGHGYTCANIAEEALLSEDEIREALEMRIDRYDVYNIRQ
jgi:hypothetical protein